MGLVRGPLQLTIDIISIRRWSSQSVGNCSFKWRSWTLCELISYDHIYVLIIGLNIIGLNGKHRVWATHEYITWKIIFNSNHRMWNKNSYEWSSSTHLSHVWSTLDAKLKNFYNHVFWKPVCEDTDFKMSCFLAKYVHNITSLTRRTNLGLLMAF